MTRPPPAETYAEVEAAIADVDRVIGIFNALLRLAEIDTGARRSGFVQVNVAAVAAEVLEFHEPAAEAKGASFAYRANAGANVHGDPVLIAQAISNLVDNVLKYVREHGAIAASVATDAEGSVAITVSDDGPGIAPAQRASVTGRFFRGDASRGKPGVGLGLSIVDAVAKLHGGALDLADNGPGLRATVVLPAGGSLAAGVNDLA